MRTTIELPDDLYETVRKRAFERRASMGAVLSDLARRGLNAERTAHARPIGLFDGQGTITDDFDALPDDVARALNAELP